MITLKNYGNDIIVNENEELQVVRGYGSLLKLEKATAKNCLGEKISHTLIPRDIEEHNQQYLKWGYLDGMNINNSIVTLKHAKRCQKIKDLFKVDGKKTKYKEELIEQNTNIYHHYDKIINCSDDEFESYLCGLVFANMRVRQKGDNTFGITFGFPIGRSQNHTDKIQAIKKRILDHTCIDRIKYNQFVIGSPDNITYFTNNIGILDTSKLSQIHRLLWSKAYKVTKIIKN